jgi:hypothetical protein
MGGITTTNSKYLYDEAISPCDKAKANSVVTVIKINRILTEQEMTDYVLTRGTLAVSVAASVAVSVLEVICKWHFFELH